MAKCIAAYESGDGLVVYAEIEPDPEEYERYAKDQLVRASQTFEEAVSGIRPIAQNILEQLRTLSVSGMPLARVDVEFGVKLVGKIGAVLVSGEAEGSFKVTLSCTPDASIQG